MSKSMLIIDTPKSCLYCDLYIPKPICACGANGVPYDEDGYDIRLGTCPLKHIPEKRDEHVKLNSWELEGIINAENRGYNNALKDILGEEE